MEALRRGAPILNCCSHKGLRTPASWHATLKSLVLDLPHAKCVKNFNVSFAISFPGPKTCMSRRLYLMSSTDVDLRSGLMRRDASNPRNPSVRLANTKKARPKRHSTEAPNFLVYNTIIRDLLLIEMAVTARFIVKRCATADVRPSSIESRLTTRYAPWCSALGSV